MQKPVRHFKNMGRRHVFSWRFNWYYYWNLFFSITRKIKVFLLLDIIACVSPIGIFLGRVANFINGELVGKVTNVPWSVIFPAVDALKTSSQLYEAFLEGIILFLIVNIYILKKITLLGYALVNF